MADNRCPLCMEKLNGGECLSCGFRLPDEEAISAIYDGEPSEQFQPEPAIREITPEIQMEEIYPNRSEPKFKVRDDEGRTVRTDVKADLKKNKNATNESNGNPYASNGNPYAGYTPDGANGNTKSPFANPSANTVADTETASGFIKKYWWLLLIALFVPAPVGSIVAIILNSAMKSELKQYKASYLLVLAIIIGFILPH